jgi:hypothetical protein
MIPARVLAVSVALAAAAGATSCAPRGVSAPDPAAPVQAVLTAGYWRLVDYRPDLSLDPVTGLLLASQIRTMVVTFDGQKLQARSSTIGFTRPYTVENVVGPTFDLVSPDVQGAGVLRSHCELVEGGRRVVFHAETDPWTGTGTLKHE